MINRNSEGSAEKIDVGKNIDYSTKNYFSPQIRLPAALKMPGTENRLLRRSEVNVRLTREAFRADVSLNQERFAHAVRRLRSAFA